jgi:hypothetical protein
MKKFNYNENLEKVLTAIFGGIGIIAIFINLHIKGYTNENWFDAIKDIAGLIVVLAVFIATIKIRNKSRTFTDVARSKLEKLQKLNTDLLIGPRYNRENYDPEKGQGIEYLFVTNEKKESTRRAKFISIPSLETGVLIIYIQPATLADALNYGRGKITEDDILNVQKAVSDSVCELLKKKYSAFYNEKELIKTKGEIAIMVDFDEQKMGKNKFAKAIEECTKEAISKLKELRIKNKN